MVTLARPWNANGIVANIVICLHGGTSSAPTARNLNVRRAGHHQVACIDERQPLPGVPEVLAAGPSHPPGRGKRVRDVREGPDAFLYVLTNAADGQLIRLEPS